MTYKTHIAAGLATGLLVTEFFPLDGSRLLFLGAAAIGSLLPDVDTESSFIRKFILLFPRMKHRGHTHSIVGFLLFSLILIPFGPTAPILGLIWGYMSHLLADAFTVSGIYVFYPRQEHKLRLGKIRTGGNGELAFQCIMICSIMLYFYYKIQNSFQMFR